MLKCYMVAPEIYRKNLFNLFKKAKSQLNVENQKSVAQTKRSVISKTASLGQLSAHGKQWCAYCRRSGHGQKSYWADPDSPSYRPPRRRANKPVINKAFHEEHASDHSAQVQEYSSPHEHYMPHPLDRDSSGNVLLDGSERRLKFKAKYLHATGSSVSIAYSGGEASWYPQILFSIFIISRLIMD